MALSWLQETLNPSIPNQHGLIKGPAGAIEVAIQFPKAPYKGVALMCHPHPLFEGTMHNKVVTSTLAALRDEQFVTVRFNFRGVGDSQGQHDHSVGEVEDALAVFDYLNPLNCDQVIVAGFSFGAYIAAALASQRPVNGLFAMAPAIPNQPYAAINPQCDHFEVFIGLKDEVIPVNEMLAFANDWASQPKPHSFNVSVLPEASHFFHGQLVALKALVKVAAQRTQVISQAKPASR